MKKKTFKFTFTVKSLLAWGMGLCIGIVWIFILGILVGRGDLSFVKMKNKLVGTQATIKESPEPGNLGMMGDNLKLEFYEELASKKEAAAQRNRATVAAKPPAREPKTIPSKTPAKTKPVSQSRQGYVLQIGSFQDKAKAAALTRRLSEHQYPAFFSKADVDGTSYYRVKCGPFKSEAKADELKKVLAKKENLHGFVTRNH